MTWWKTLAKEPLVHFVLLGGAVVAVDASRTHEASRTVDPSYAQPVDQAIDRTLVVDRDASEREIDQEILFREAIARGLERDDPMIRERVASRMSFVLAESVVVPEPTETELRAWFDTHRDRYAQPERIDFTHVFVADADAARADALAAQLAAGAAPETLGDAFAGGRKYRGRKLADLAEAFGADFVAGLTTQPANAWVRRRSRHGLHLVRVDRIAAARGPDFETAKLEVRREVVEERRAKAGGDAFRKLRAGWTVVRR